MGGPGSGRRDRKPRNGGRKTVPEKEKKKTRSVQFTDREWQQVREYAEKNGFFSASAVIIQILKEKGVIS